MVVLVSRLGVFSGTLISEISRSGFGLSANEFLGSDVVGVVLLGAVLLGAVLLGVAWLGVALLVVVLLGAISSNAESLLKLLFLGMSSSGLLISEMVSRPTS